MPSRTLVASSRSIGCRVSECVRDDPDQRTLERPDVVGDAFGDQLEHTGVGERDPVESDALAEDRDAGREVRRSDLGDQARLEALAEPLLDGHQLARGAGRRSARAAGRCHTAR